MHKVKRVKLTPKYGSYGKIKKKQRLDMDARLHQIGVARTITGVLVVVFLCFGAYLVTSRFIIPNIVGESEPVDVEKAITNENPDVLVIEKEYLEYDVMGLPIYNDDEVLFEVSPDNPLPEDYEIELERVLGVQVNSKMSQALRALDAAATEDGFTLNVIQGYVTPGEQEQLYNSRVQDLEIYDGYTSIMAEASAEFFTPKPNESDIQTGFLIKLDGAPDTFKNQPIYTWLVENAATYGFIFRYPEGKEDDTGHVTDLTVLRYVGMDAAIEMRQLSMSFEEYLTYMK